MLVNEASKPRPVFDLDPNQVKSKLLQPLGQRPRTAPQSILNHKRRQPPTSVRIASIEVKSKTENDNSSHSKDEYLKSPEVEDVLSGAIRHILENVSKCQDILPELLIYFKGSVAMIKRSPGDTCPIDNEEIKSSYESEVDISLELQSISTLLVVKLLQERPQERKLIKNRLASMVEDMMKKKNPQESSFAATIEALRNAKITEDWDALMATLIKDPSCKQEVRDLKSIVILVLGKGPCGKSTLIATLKGKKNPKCKPTMGFRPSSMKYKQDITIKFHDIGGSDGIRGIWHHYYRSANGIVYMLDSSCSRNDFDKSLEVARDSFSHEDVHGKPLLIIKNKVDIKVDQKCGDIKGKMGLSSWGAPVKVLETTLNGQQTSNDRDQENVDRCIEWLIQATLSTDKDQL